ncbi:hypothetical protein [Enterovibrio nigricans]|uniref:Uncharacterized protein n=1 Tax=Enterovibrio nigricans DSM 22720 TaxID=1121868 RepID=A0A1T4UMK8_9GAMM|nr:hypothetical protein [Enterovibrio nigricans]PKF49860.1 hypothetical protein AT251_15795 [Enterovibrio nigricans]SKA53903.1 hypothetical protein SAMN02745132_02050 [Enterovibrio nigricans DSM 22720]
MKSIANNEIQAAGLKTLCDTAVNLHPQNKPQSLSTPVRRKRASLKRTRSADAVLLDLSLQMPE